MSNCYTIFFLKLQYKNTWMINGLNLRLFLLLVDQTSYNYYKRLFLLLPLIANDKEIKLPMITHQNMEVKIKIEIFGFFFFYDSHQHNRNHFFLSLPQWQAPIDMAQQIFRFVFIRF